MTSAARTRRYRARLAGLPDPDAPQPCPICGRLVRSSRTAPLCSRCWKRSPPGREANRLRMQARRAADRAEAHSISIPVPPLQEAIAMVRVEGMTERYAARKCGVRLAELRHTLYTLE